MRSANRRPRSRLSSTEDSFSSVLYTPSISSDEPARSEIGSSGHLGSLENEQRNIDSIQQILELEQHLKSTERELMDRVRQWNAEKTRQSPELRLTYRPRGQSDRRVSDNSSTLSLDSTRPVDVVAVKQYLKRKRDDSEGQSQGAIESSSTGESPASQRSFKGSHSWDESFSLALSRSTTPSSRATVSSVAKANLDKMWHQTEFSFPVFQFLQDYSPMFSTPAASAEERNRVNMLSSCSIFLRSRARRDNLQLPPISASSNSQAIAVNTEHIKALSMFRLSRISEAREAVDACCRLMEALVLTQQPSLLSCVTVIVSELTSIGRPEFASQVLQFVSELAQISLGLRHPITVFLWCMRASDIPTQRVLTEEFLLRAISQLQRLDANGLKELVSDYQFRLMRIYQEQGKLSAALDLMKARAYHYEVHFGHYHWETSNIIYQIARTHYLAGDMEEAKFNFLDVLQRVPRLSEDAENRTWLRMNAHGRLAQIYKKLGDDEQAKEHAIGCLKGPNDGEKEIEDEWRKTFADEEYWSFLFIQPPNNSSSVSKGLRCGCSGYYIDETGTCLECSSTWEI